MPRAPRIDCGETKAARAPDRAQPRFDRSGAVETGRLGLNGKDWNRPKRNLKAPTKGPRKNNFEFYEGMIV